MAWQAMAIKAAVGAIGNTMSAISDSRKNQASERLLEQGISSFVHTNNVSLTRERASQAVRGFVAGTSVGVNEERQNTINAMGEYAMQRDALRSATQAGFINAAMGTTLDATETGLEYRRQGREEAETQELELLA